MSKFEVGQRVSAQVMNAGSWVSEIVTGTVSAVKAGAVQIDDGHGNRMWVVERACRRLKKKQRRRVWIKNDDLQTIPNNGALGCFVCTEEREGYTCFIEKRRGSK